MYCILKYIEFPDFQRQYAAVSACGSGKISATITDQRVSVLTASSLKSTAASKTTNVTSPSLASSSVLGPVLNDVKTKQLYFNPNCFVQLIIDYICDEVGIKTESDFDLTNEDGDLLNIKDYEPLSNGTVMFTPRETYFVVLQARNSTGKIMDVQVLLTQASEEYFLVSTHLFTKIPNRTLSSERQAVTFRKKRGSKSSKDSKTVFDFTHGFGVLKKPKTSKSKSQHHLGHN